MGETILKNLTDEIVAVWPLVFPIVYFVGFVIVGIGVMRLVRAGDPNAMLTGRSGVAVAFAAIFAGVALLNIRLFMDAGAQTFFREPSLGMLEVRPKGNDLDALYLTFAVALIQLMGLIAQARGLMQISRAGQEQGAIATGATRIVGGILAVNLPTVIRVIGDTAGGTVGAMVDRFF